MPAHVQGEGPAGTSQLLEVRPPNKKLKLGEGGSSSRDLQKVVKEDLL